MSLYENKKATPVLEVFQNLAHQTISVGTTAVKLPATELIDRKSIIIQNKMAAKNVYLGTSVVTADDAATGGYKLRSNSEIQINLNNHDIYAIVASGTANVAILELG